MAKNRSLVLGLRIKWENWEIKLGLVPEEKLGLVPEEKLGLVPEERLVLVPEEKLEEPSGVIPWLSGRCSHGLMSMLFSTPR